ncbi:PAS domain S-box-containing protein [Desulfobotulus alkaliphilus]|uniref:histidine kinase n=1 Tax=Desulfobotulus alkaliphilus TaxID=622671 RepID=A0A562RV53_9BACT|nr:ATP-binding protein [Desulfobotulus alkaliphilus]TWI72260.1 PAS domain S-box-containing protein [Desulfobotulus alkaliphilus]
MTAASISTLLRRYLALRLLLPVVFLVLTLSALLGWQRWQDIQREQHLQTLALSEYVATYLSFSREIINLMAESSDLRGFPEVIPQFIKHSNAFERILLLSDQGEVMATIPPMGSLKDYSRLMPANHRNRDKQDVYISSPYQAPLSSKITASLFSYPVNHKVVAGELNLRSLQNFIAGLGQTGDSAFFFITDRYGNLVAHPDQKMVEEQTNLGKLQPVQEGLGGEAIFLGIHRTNGVHHLFSSAPVLGGDWVVFTAWNAREKFFSVFTTMGVLTVLLLLLLSTTVWLLQHNLNKEISLPLATFAEAMDSLERGEEKNIRYLANLKKTPFQEFQILRQGFIDMAEAIAQREKALRSSESRFRNLADALPESVFETDLSYNFQYMNQKTLEQFGYTKEEEAAGLSLMDFSIGDEHNLIFDYLWKTIGQEIIAPLSFTALRKNGQTFSAQLHISTIFNNEKPVGIRGFIIDVTRVREEQAQRLEMERRLLHSQKLESLGVMAGGIAHDFNNILAAIQGNLELALLDTPVSSPAHDSLGKAGTAVARATDLTRQMLAYSGKGQFLVQRIGLNRFIEENMTMLQAVMPKTITMETRLAPELPEIMADPGQLQQVVINLITNASEAMEEQPGTLSIHTGVRFCDQDFLRNSRGLKKPAPGNFIFLMVKDTGCGMNKESLDRLFEPFYTTKFTGRGLGLSAVLGIMQGHKGAIMVDSRPDKGTSFQVFFPALQETDLLKGAEASKSAEIQSERQENGNKGMVLVVDDEEMLRKLYADALEMMGYTPLAARDGQEAMELFHRYSQHILCVILDLTMPRMDGKATLGAMRCIRPDMKIILCSGYNEQETIGSFTENSPSRFLKKPFSMAALQFTMEELLSQGE